MGGRPVGPVWSRFLRDESAGLLWRACVALTQILGVSPSATPEEIKKAYQRESLRCHPDRFPNATPDETRAHTQRFQSVADACAYVC